jgi:hypothetical protein
MMLIAVLLTFEINKKVIMLLKKEEGQRKLMLWQLI